MAEKLALSVNLTATDLYNYQQNLPLQNTLLKNKDASSQFFFARKTSFLSYSDIVFFSFLNASHLYYLPKPD